MPPTLLMPSPFVTPRLLARYTFPLFSFLPTTPPIAVASLAPDVTALSAVTKVPSSAPIVPVGRPRDARPPCRSFVMTESEAVARFNRSRVGSRDAARVRGFDAVAEGCDAGYFAVVRHLCGYYSGVLICVAEELRGVDAEVFHRACEFAEYAGAGFIRFRGVCVQADDAEAAPVERAGVAVRSTASDFFVTRQRRRVDVILEREVVFEDVGLPLLVIVITLYAIELFRIAYPDVRL